MGLVMSLFLLGCQPDHPHGDTDSGPLKAGIICIKYTYSLSEIATPLNQDVILFFERLTDQLTLRLDSTLPHLDWLDIEDFYRLPEYENLPTSFNTRMEFSPPPYTYSDFVAHPNIIADFCEQTQLNYAIVIAFGTSSPQPNTAQVVAKVHVFNARGQVILYREYPLGVFWRQFQAAPDINGIQKPYMDYPENRALYERAFRVFLDKVPKELEL